MPRYPLICAICPLEPHSNAKISSVFSFLCTEIISRLSLLRRPQRFASSRAATLVQLDAFQVHEFSQECAWHPTLLPEKPCPVQRFKLHSSTAHHPIPHISSPTPLCANDGRDIGSQTGETFVRYSACRFSPSVHSLGLLAHNRGCIVAQRQSCDPPRAICADPTRLLVASNFV